MRVLAIDPGEKNIGIALSDLTGTIANPLTVLKHISRDNDAAEIARIAMEHGATLILIGQVLGLEGEVTYQSRRASRLAATVRKHTDIPVELWDESGSTKSARSASLAMGISRRKRHGHLDNLAAAVILQDYLDLHH